MMMTSKIRHRSQGTLIGGAPTWQVWVQAKCWTSVIIVVCIGLGTELETNNDDCVKELYYYYVKLHSDKIYSVFFYCRVLFSIIISVFLSHLPIQHCKGLQIDAH